MNAEDPLLILYTSGSTGAAERRAAIITGGYLGLRRDHLFKYAPDYHPGDIYRCTADVGCCDGAQAIRCMACHSRGATITLMFEGVPNWPTPARMCRSTKHQSTSLYRPDGQSAR